MGAVVVDVTSLPDTSRVKEVGRIRMPETQNGFHETYTYRHSDGRSLFFGTSGAPFVAVYDMDKFLSAPDGPNRGLAARIPLPETGRPRPPGSTSPGPRDYLTIFRVV